MIVRFTSRHILVLVILYLTVTIEAANPVASFSAYAEMNMPVTASLFISIGTDIEINGNPYVFGYFIDTDGDGRSDMDDVGLIDPRTLGLQVIWSTLVSPSDPDIVYIFGDPLETAEPFGARIILVRRTNNGWAVVSGPHIVPMQLRQDRIGLNSPGVRSFSADWVSMQAVRRVHGGDSVLVVRNRRDAGGSFFTTSYATLSDSDDVDGFADFWSPATTLSNYDPFTLDAVGGVLARHLPDIQSPFSETDQIVRLIDPDRDGIPTINGLASTTVTPDFLRITSGWGDFDIGSDRAYITDTGICDFDSYCHPIQGSVRDLDFGQAGIIPFDALQLVAGRDGNPVSEALDQLHGFEFTISTWTDLNFDGRTNNYTQASVPEVRPFVRDADFPQMPTQSGIVMVSVADLPVIPMVGGGGGVAFRDDGVFPDGSSFRFRFGSRDFESIWIGAKGIVSFAGPVTEDASLDGLSSSQSVIAPMWSDEWDTSRVEIHAGHAPVQPSFRTGQPVKTFAVEWRGLRAPGWDDDQRCSMRLLLFEDGGYRVDFGAMEGAELGPMHLVSGYAGPGSHASSIGVDVSAHSWGSAPAGAGQERVAGEEFSAAKLSDVGHKWTRWNGYPERLDTAGPAPKLLDARRQGGKLLLDTAGSDIARGATLVVDDTDRFALKRKGARWIVKKKARSAPGSRTIAEIWADGQPHRVFVVNPDGETSELAIVE